MYGWVCHTLGQRCQPFCICGEKNLLCCCVDVFRALNVSVMIPFGTLDGWINKWTTLTGMSNYGPMLLLLRSWYHRDMMDEITCSVESVVDLELFVERV